MVELAEAGNKYHAFYKDLSDFVEGPGQELIKQIEELILAIELGSAQSDLGRRAMAKLIIIRKRILDSSYPSFN